MGRHFSCGPSDDRVCSHCGVKCHIKEKCFEFHGWPDWYQGRGRGGRSGGRVQGHIKEKLFDLHGWSDWYQVRDRGLGS